MFGNAKGILRKLRSDTAGATLAIVAAALIPLIAMIGSGLDVSRAYMAKSRLQSACDAASLAARRAMRNDNLSASVIATGNQFFDFNFPQGLYQTEDFEPSITKPQVGVVRIEAQTRIPTTLMRIFGFETLPLNVSCDASLNFVNTDVVLVLDVTGSMLDPVDGTPKIEALRDAVMALYDELAPIQAQLEAQGLRLRYGIVPYSSTVNVGNLLADEDVNFIRQNSTYTSRVARYSTTPNDWDDEPVETPITTAQTGLLYTPGTQRFRVSNVDRLISNANCTNYITNTTFSQTTSGTNGGSYTAAVASGDYDLYDPDGAAPLQANRPAEGTNFVRYRFSRVTATWSGTSNRVCDRTVTITRGVWTPRYPFVGYTYQDASISTANFAAGSAINIVNSSAPAFIYAPDPQRLNTQLNQYVYTPRELAGSTTLNGAPSSVAVTWNGCIEERQTVNTITSSSGLTIPSGAWDLNLNAIPNSEQTRWVPMLPQAIYTRAGGNTAVNSTDRTNNSSWIMNYDEDQGYYACPTEARRLDEWTRADLEDYVDSLAPVGGTYHDIGMIWGGRFISTGGVFADGCEEFNGMPCNRHVIFMTDGQQTAYCNVYTAYNVERNAGRVRGGNDCTSDTQTATATANLLSRHQQRFQMACNATRNMNVSVWVIAFATTMSTPMENCATNEDQASTSTNRAQLIARFREIGNQIGSLRLVK